MLACTAVLLLVLALNGALTLGAMRSVHQETVAAATRVVGHDLVWRIEGALRFGKPIGQFYGLQDMLAEVMADLPAVVAVAVTGPDGAVLAARGAALPPTEVAVAVRRAVGAGEEARPPPRAVRGLHAFPVAGRGGEPAGALVLAVSEEAATAAVEVAAAENLGVLLVVGGGGGLVLLAAFLLAPALRRDVADLGRRGARLRLLGLPVVVLVVAQALYTWHGVERFRADTVEAMRDSAGLAADRLQRDLDRLLAKGVRIERLNGLDKPFLRIMAHQEAVAFMELAGADGRPLVRVGRDGAVETAPQPVAAGARDVVRRLHGATGEAAGALRMALSEDAVAAVVQRRLLDSGTVAVVSALFMVELVIVLTLSLAGAAARSGAAAAAAGAGAGPGRGPGPGPGSHLLARPASFLLVFAWALPLSFVPLRMRELYVPALPVPEDVVLALPVSAEMLCALVGALLAGAGADRRGWHVPFLAGVLLSAGGAAWSAVAGDMASLVLARAVVGLGYGLAWMGIQSFVFLWAPPQGRARGVANLVAGIFAGHICGSAVGAMLAEQVGYAPVLLAAAVLGLVPGLFALHFMRAWMRRPEPPAAGPVRAAGSLRALGRSRDFVWLLLGSVVPFSIAQVGLLYYTLPLFLADQGVAQGSIGRIMMLYGLSVIYLGPPLGRVVDRAQRKKGFIVLAGLTGSAGMIYLFFDHSLIAVTQAVVLLGLASAIGGAAQSAYALDLPEVQAAGAGRAMSVQRAADKLGQMMGPLALGALFAGVGAGAGLAATGLFYLLATLAFLALARGRAASTAGRPG